ncbi:MAG: Gfo/Idh/MocA family oxidoreductase [Chloroflexi bacterium]|nr:Gfo/Idh/MocA family oxidoreductase [Chloroflexota bacterium]
MPDQPLQVAVIGCGHMGEQHALALSHFSKARCATVYDPVAGRAQEFARRFGAARANTLNDIWQDSQIEAVVVATPTDTHHPYTLAAAQSKKHVLLEKPAALSLAHLQEMQAACDRAGVILLVGQLVRFQELGRALGDSVAAGDVGQPVFFNFVTNVSRLWPGGWEAWQTAPAQSGGMPLHLGIHGIDLALWLMNSAPVRVYAQGANTVISALDLHDYFHMLVTCANGSNILVELHTGLAGKGNSYQSAFLLGTRGEAQWNVGEDGFTLSEGGAKFFPAGYGRSVQVELDHFVDCCRGRVQPLVTAEQVRWSLAAALAANISLERGTPVAISEILAEAQA